MRYGKIAKNVALSWTLSAIECYERRCVCTGCWYDRIFSANAEHDCMMAYTVLRLLQRFGPPSEMNRQEALWKSTVAGVARMPDPNRKQKILDYLEDYGPVSSREMAEHFSVNVTTINAHMRELSSAGSVRRSGPYNMRQWRISI